CLWVSLLRLTPADWARVTMSRLPDERIGLPANSRAIASVIASRSAWLSMAPPSAGDTRLLGTVDHRFQDSGPLTQPFRQGDRGERSSASARSWAISARACAMWLSVRATLAQAGLQRSRLGGR